MEPDTTKMRPMVMPNARASGQMARWSALTVITSVAVLAGCGGSNGSAALSDSTTAGRSQTPAAAAQWDEPDSYSFTLDSRCGERDGLGLFRITVADSAVTHAEGMDAAARQYVEDPEFRDQIPTLAMLLREVDSARAAGSDVADVIFDPVDGHPTSIILDYNAKAEDDEACYDVADYSASTGQ